MPSAAVDPDATAVLFDFDGTLGDTETPAMRAAFWELAPYFPDATADNAHRRRARRLRPRERG